MNDRSRFYPQTLEKLKKQATNNQKTFLGLSKQLGLGVNYNREYLDLLADISRRDKKSFSAIIKQKDLQEILSGPNFPRPRKIEKLKELLTAIRYSSVAPEIVSNKTPKPRKKPVLSIEQKGEFIRQCPGTPGYICCGYYVFKNALGCAFDCTYCFLHNYTDSSKVINFSNLDKLEEETKRFFQDNKDKNLRIGTGEFSDSLALPEQIELSKRLISLFSRQKQHLLELKTKSDRVDELLGLDHQGQTVIGWSVNSEKIVKSEELGTASLKNRLNAAKKAVNAGYKVAFHFDPLVYYKGWEKDYQKTVDLVFSKIDPKDIAWISLGCLRFHPHQKDIMENKFPHSRLTLGPLLPQKDNKLRYPEEIRIEMFQHLIDLIRGYSNGVFVYLCMENAHAWKNLSLENDKKNPNMKYFQFSSR